jgi:hypothetical protein
MNKDEENEYLVLWAIDIEAPSPRTAAWYARDAQVREDTIATVFDVQDKITGTVTQVDLDADPETDHVISNVPVDYYHDHGGPPHRHDSDGNPCF